MAPCAMPGPRRARKVPNAVSIRPEPLVAAITRPGKTLFSPTKEATKPLAGWL